MSEPKVREKTNDKGAQGKLPLFEWVFILDTLMH